MAAPDPGLYLKTGTRRKSKVLVYKGFKYQKNRAKKNIVYMYRRCHRAECQITMSTLIYNEKINKPDI